MSREQNVKLVRQGVEVYFQAYVEAYSGGGFGALAKFWHPDIEYREDPDWPEAATCKGREAVLAAFQAHEEVMGPYTVALERAVDAGEEFAFVVLASGSGASRGAPHEYRYGYVGRLVDGLIVDLQAYLNADAALEAGMRK